VVILLAILVTAVAWTFIGFALYGKWTTDLPTDQTTRADATRLVLTITAGIGAAIALVVAYRRQSNLEEGRFLERLATAARQIGDREPIVQFSGIYALVALADEPTATGVRQTARSQQCVSVLCAYLRLPYSPGAHESFVEEIVHKQTWANSQGHIEETRTYGVRPADKEIRHTIIRIIGEHLQPNTSSSWSDLSLDFKGAVFDGGDFSNAVFNGPLTDFSGAQFTGGTVDFRDGQFTGGTVDFRDGQFTGGTVDFSGGQFTGSTVDFTCADFSGGTVHFSDADFSGGTVHFSGGHFTGSTVDFHGADFSGGTVHFSVADFSGGTVDFGFGQFTGGTVDFLGGHFTGSTVGFPRAEFSGGTVDFRGAEFSGGTVHFSFAQFTGGTVDFSFAQFTGGTVDFGYGQFTGGTVHFSFAQFTGGTVDFGYGQFTGGTVDVRLAEFTGGTVDFKEVTGADPGILEFTNPVSWEVPPVVPWATGDVPSWVIPAVWPPAIAS
jgi:uncharacterized protein YjbI with pentapeptide repeats